MSARRTAVLVTTAAATLLVAAPALASTPGASTVGDGATVTYTGTAPPGANATSECLDLGEGDTHALTYTGPSDGGTVTASITWTPVADSLTSDLILTVFDSAGRVVGSADGSTTTESVTFGTTRDAVYTVQACGFVNGQPQPYSGRLVAETPSAGGGTAGPPDPVFTSGDVVAPAPVVPEIPLAVLAPLAAMAIGGVAFGLTRVRSA